MHPIDPSTFSGAIVPAAGASAENDLAAAATAHPDAPTLQWMAAQQAAANIEPPVTDADMQALADLASAIAGGGHR